MRDDDFSFRCPDVPSLEHTIKYHINTGIGTHFGTVQLTQREIHPEDTQMRHHHSYKDRFDKLGNKVRSRIALVESINRLCSHQQSGSLIGDRCDFSLQPIREDKLAVEVSELRQPARC